MTTAIIERVKDEDSERAMSSFHFLYEGGETDVYVVHDIKQLPKDGLFFITKTVARDVLNNPQSEGAGKTFAEMKKFLER